MPKTGVYPLDYWFVLDLQLSLPIIFKGFSTICMYHFYVSQSDYYNIDFLCSSKKMLTHFLVSWMFLSFNVSAYSAFFIYFFVYVVPQSSMDDGFCNSSRKFAS